MSVPFYLALPLVLTIATAGSPSSRHFSFPFLRANRSASGITGIAVAEFLGAQALRSQSSFKIVSEKPPIETDSTSSLQQMFDHQTVNQLKQNIESKHPIAYYFVAVKLFKQDKEEAVFWYYLGQLRYRYYLAANPNIDPTGNPALFASLSSVVGTPINEYAFGNLQTLAATIDRVLAWDECHANGYPSKAKHPAQLKKVRRSLKELKEKILQDQDQIRKKRSQSGLENRP